MAADIVGDIIERLECFDAMYRIALVGESGVGKTVLMNYYTADYCRNRLEEMESSHSTVGAGVGNKMVTLSSGKTISLNIIDTGSNVQVVRSAQVYFGTSEDTCLGVLLVFDVNDKKTLERVDEYWVQYIRSIRADSIIYLIGNKGFGALNREVSVRQGQLIADKYNMKYFEANSYNVDPIFTLLVEDINEHEMKNIDALYQIRIIGESVITARMEHTCISVTLPRRKVKLRIKTDTLSYQDNGDKYRLLSSDNIALCNDGVFLFCDLTRQETFKGVINYWNTVVTSPIGRLVKCVYLIGTNCFLIKEREVSMERAVLITDELGIKYFEIPESTLDVTVIGELIDKYMTLNYSETS